MTCTIYILAPRLFKKENVMMYNTYDHVSGKRRNSGMELQTIYKDPEFLKWREQLEFELNKIEEDSYIIDILKLLNGFSGFADKSRFEKLEAKLYVLREHLDEYRDSCSEVQIEDDKRISEKEISDKILRVLSKMQRNHHYDADCS